MAIRARFIGRLGNNLFQYAFCRILREKYGCDFECADLGSWSLTFRGQPIDNGPSATLAELSHRFGDVPLRMGPYDSREVVFERDVNTDPSWDGQHVLVDDVLRYQATGVVLLGGYFQRIEYYVDHRDLCRKWFALGRSALPVSVKPSDVVVSVRRGFDYGSLGWTLSPSYYAKILGTMPALGTVFLCGTCIDSAFVKRLEAFNPVVVPGTPLEHMALLTSASRLVLANSTFAWWGGFLSRAEEIHAPKGSGGVFGFSGYKNVHLGIQDRAYNEHDAVIDEVFEPFTVTQAGVEIVTGRSEAAVLDDRARSILSFICEQRSAVSQTELVEATGSDGLDEAIAKLVRAGLMAVSVRYRQAKV